MLILSTFRQLSGVLSFGLGMIEARGQDRCQWRSAEPDLLQIFLVVQYSVRAADSLGTAGE